MSHAEDERESRAQRFEQQAVEAIHALNPDGDALATTLSFNFFRAVNRLQRDLEANAYRVAGISGAAFSVMFMLKAAGSVSPGRLTALLGTSTPATSSVLRTLEKHGFIRRIPDEQDGRRVVVHLTPSGEQKLQEAFSLASVREHEWASALTKAETLMLMELLRTLLRSPRQTEA